MCSCALGSTPKGPRAGSSCRAQLSVTSHQHWRLRTTSPNSTPLLCLSHLPTPPQRHGAHAPCASQSGTAQRHGAHAPCASRSGTAQQHGAHAPCVSRSGTAQRHRAHAPCASRSGTGLGTATCCVTLRKPLNRSEPSPRHLSHEAVVLVFLSSDNRLSSSDNLCRVAL